MTLTPVTLIPDTLCSRHKGGNVAIETKCFAKICISVVTLLTRNRCNFMHMKAFYVNVRNNNSSFLGNISVVKNIIFDMSLKYLFFHGSIKAITVNGSFMLSKA